MGSVLQEAIASVRKAQAAYCHFITPNDVGATGAHQSGFTVPAVAYSMFFDTPGHKGEVKDHFIKIRWQGDFTELLQIVDERGRTAPFVYNRSSSN